MRGIQHETMTRSMGNNYILQPTMYNIAAAFLLPTISPTLRVHVSEGLEIASERNKEICQILTSISTLVVLKSTPYPEIGVERLKRWITLHANSLTSFLTIRVIPITN